MKRNHNYKGGGIDQQGYRTIYVGGKQVREHRVVAAQKIGRALLPREIVHHINGDKADNRPENLEVIASQAEHCSGHMTTERAREMALKGAECLRHVCRNGHPRTKESTRYRKDGRRECRICERERAALRALGYEVVT